MREQLIHYIDLLFAGAPEAAEMKQEILQNTLDRYDDLIAQGKQPEAAYRLAISGIGDINEILGGEAAQPRPAAPTAPTAPAAQPAKSPVTPTWKILLRGIAIALYILCPVPVLVLQDEIGVCGLLALVAVATVLMVVAGGKSTPTEKAVESTDPKLQLRKSVSGIVWSVGVCVYLLISFATHAWYITWLVFPIAGFVQGLIYACMDLKEAN